jgi:hypothetical protein
MFESYKQIPDDGRLIGFIVFDPSSQRIHESDLLVRGAKVKEIFDQAYYELSRRQGLSNTILLNRLGKLQKMLDLVDNFDNVIMTKFFDRIWRRYGQLSHLGEIFLDLRAYREIFAVAESDKASYLATRMDDEEDEVHVEESETPPGPSDEQKEAFQVA